MRAMFSHSLLYPPRPMPSLMDHRLVLPAGAPPVGFPPAGQTATLPLFAPPLPDRDATSQLLHHSGVVDEQRCRFPAGATGEMFTDATSRS